jgi:hypothetical protein
LLTSFVQHLSHTAKSVTLVYHLKGASMLLLIPVEKGLVNAVRSFEMSVRIAVA